MKWLFALVLSVFAVSPAMAEYYFMIFSQDSTPVPMPQSSHIWGTFIQVEKGKLVKEVTISWAPEIPWSIKDKTQKGYNMTLHESIDDALRQKRKICMWGPFAINGSLFLQAECQHRLSGNYKCIDGLCRSSATNCIHRLSDITGVRLTTHFRYGACAGSAIHKHYLKCGLITPAYYDLTDLLGGKRLLIHRK